MTATSMMRFIVLGAIGFGLGGAITRPLSLLLPGMVALPLTVLIAGAVGGASLGLALKDWRRVVILAGLGALGLTVGVMAGLIIGSYFFYYSSEVPITVIVGLVVGASLGAAFRDWRTILALAVAGAVGFSVGNFAGDFLRFSFPIIRLVGQVGEVGSIAAAGLVGGAFMGAALGYLEKRKLTQEQRPRVR
jgi:hypothetical protein